MNEPAITREEINFPYQWTEHIRLLGVKEFPYYLISGKTAAAIFEGGLSALASTVLQHVEISRTAAPLKYLAVAHAHTDHVTGLLKLKLDRPDLKLIGHPKSAELLAKEKILANFINEDAAYGGYLLQEKMIEGPPEALPMHAVVFDRALKHEETLDLGGVRITFIDAPGHAPGNFCAWVEPDRVLLISDSAGYAQSATDFYPLFFHNFSWYVASLKQLPAYHPEHIGLGHNLTIDGAEPSLAFLELAVESAERMKKEIGDGLARGEARNALARDWAKRLTRYGLFGHFSPEMLEGYTDLLIRRALE